MRISDWSSDVCSSDLDLADLQKTQLSNLEKTVRTAMRGEHGADDDIAIGELRRTANQVSFLVRDQRQLDEARERMFSETRGAAMTGQDRKSTRLNSSH